MIEFWPLIAFGLVVIPVRLDADPAVPAFIAAAGGALFVATRWAWWLRPGAEVSASMALLSIAEAILGGVTAGLFLLIMPWVPGGLVWFVLLAAMSVAALATAVVQIVRGRRGGSRPAPGALEQARRLHHALPVEDRERVAADLGAAVDRLAEAGIVTPQDAARARHTQPLLLARSFSTVRV